MPPVLLEALPVQSWSILYDGTNGAEVVGWVGEDAQFVEGELIVTTPDGRHVVEPGQTIMRGVIGEHYPILPEVRAKKYRPVSGIRRRLAWRRLVGEGRS